MHAYYKSFKGKDHINIEKENIKTKMQTLLNSIKFENENFIKSKNELLKKIVEKKSKADRMQWK